MLFISSFWLRYIPFPVLSLKMDKKTTNVILVVTLDLIGYFLFFIKKTTRLKLNSLLDIVIVDFPSSSSRFQLTYVLLSLSYNFRFFIRLYLREFSLVPSSMGVFPSAGWLEREAWDMFGICFSNNLDLRRILTDYGFDGFPLRKDFPLSGFSEVRYDDTEKRIVIEPLEVAQEFRRFSFNSPWVPIDN